MNKMLLSLTLLAFLSACTATNDYRSRYCQDPTKCHHWFALYKPEIDYINKTNHNVNLRSGPALRFEVVGKLAAGQGGHIRNCNQKMDWCFVKTSQKSGWVKMEYMGEK